MELQGYYNIKSDKNLSHNNAVKTSRNSMNCSSIAQRLASGNVLIKQQTVFFNQNSFSFANVQHKINNAKYISGSFIYSHNSGSIKKKG